MGAQIESKKMLDVVCLEQERMLLQEGYMLIVDGVVLLGSWEDNSITRSPR